MLKLVPDGLLQSLYPLVFLSSECDIKSKGCPLPTFSYLNGADGANEASERCVNVGRGPVGESSRLPAEPPRPFRRGRKSFFPTSALTRSGARVRSLPAQPSIARLYLRPRQPDPPLPPASRSKAPSAPPFPLSLAPPLGLDGTHAGGGAPSARLRSAPRADPFESGPRNRQLGKRQCVCLRSPGADSGQSRRGRRLVFQACDWPVEEPWPARV